MKKLKTVQRGSVLSIVVIIVVVLILVIGGLFFITSSSLNSARSQKVQTSAETVNTNTVQSQVPISENQKQYNDPSGFFTFTYPSDLEITKYTPTNGITAILSEWPFAVNITQKTAQGNNKFDIEVALDETLAVNFEKASQMKGSSNFSRQDVTIGGVKGYRLYYESLIFGKTVKSVRYVFPLTYNNSKVVLYEKIDAWDSSWLSKAEPIAKSIKIDITKVPMAADKLKNSPVIQGMQQGEQKAELNNADAQVKSLIAQIRTDAENSYDANQSYAQVCSQSQYLSQIKTKTGNKVKCSADSSYYVVTAQLPSGSFYCVDTTGYVGKATAFQAGQTCAR